MKSRISASHPLFLEGGSKMKLLSDGSKVFQEDQNLEKAGEVNPLICDSLGDGTVSIRLGSEEKPLLIIAGGTTGGVPDKGLVSKEVQSGKDGNDDISSVPASKLGGPSDASLPDVFSDAFLQVGFKEYNLRKSTSQKNITKLVGKEKQGLDSSNDSASYLTADKRPRSDDLEEVSIVAAKRIRGKDVQRKRKEVDMQHEEDEEGEGREESTEQKQPILNSIGSQGMEQINVKKKQADATKKHVRGRKKSVTKEASDDDPIVCALCLKKDSEMNLGFLFGPYKSLGEEKEVCGEGESKVCVIGAVGGGGDEPRSPWVHEDCAVWAPGVCLVGGKLLGFHDAVTDGRKLVRKLWCETEYS